MQDAVKAGLRCLAGTQTSVDIDLWGNYLGSDEHCNALGDLFNCLVGLNAAPILNNIGINMAQTDAKGHYLGILKGGAKCARTASFGAQPCRLPTLFWLWNGFLHARDLLPLDLSENLGRPLDIWHNVKELEVLHGLISLDTLYLNVSGTVRPLKLSLLRRSNIKLVHPVVKRQNPCSQFSQTPHLETLDIKSTPIKSSWRAQPCALPSTSREATKYKI